MDFIKFGTRALIARYNKSRGKTGPPTVEIDEATGLRLTRTTSRAQSIHASLYSNRTSFLAKATRKVGLRKGTTINQNELRRVGSHQVQKTGTALAR